jgi:hypothetical protein
MPWLVMVIDVHVLYVIIMINGGSCDFDAAKIKDFPRKSRGGGRRER